MPQYEDVYEPPILDSTGQAIANAIQGLNPTVPSFISDAFSVERNYSKGDICIYDNKVYEFTSAKSAGAWDSTKVTQTTIGAVCTSLNNSLTQLTTTESDTITGTYISTNGWTIKKIGKIVFLQIDAFKDIPNGSFTLGGTIPSKYRPTDTARIFTITRRSTTLSLLAFSVETTGSVICYNYASANDGSNYRDLISWSID